MACVGSGLEPVGVSLACVGIDLPTVGMAVEHVEATFLEPATTLAVVGAVVGYVVGALAVVAGGRVPGGEGRLGNCVVFVYFSKTGGLGVATSSATGLVMFRAVSRAESEAANGLRGLLSTRTLRARGLGWRGRMGLRTCAAQPPAPLTGFATRRV